MAFTKALYYPYIDISDSGWLKNVLLYWDSIQTIVPFSIDDPYKQRESREFHDAGLLVPLRVNPSMQEVDELSEDVVRYLNTQEGANAVFSRQIQRRERIHVEKLPEPLRTAFMYPDKLPYIVLDRFQSRRQDEWLEVGASFASFYMTLLATNLASHRGISLLTNDQASASVSDLAKADAGIQVVNNEWRFHPRNHHSRPKKISEALLANMVLEQIKISPDTSVKKIIKFREDNRAAIGRFRSEIGRLTSVVPEGQSLAQIRQQISDIYFNEVVPALDDLKASLNGSKIKWISDNIMKVSMLSVAPTALAMMLGLSSPIALLASTGVSLVANSVAYNVDKKERLRRNPYSFLVAASRGL